MIKLIQGDCLETLKSMPDKSVDLVLTDPPYGITKDKWDVKPSTEYFNEIFRISKNQIIFGGHWFDLPKKDGWIVWNKMPFLKTTNQCEFLWTSFLKKNKIIDFRYAGNVVGNTKRPNYKREKVFFTSEKPVEFLVELMNVFCKDMNVILDPFMGTGNVGVAAIATDKSFTGIELELKHYEIAQKRVNKEIV